MQHLDEGTIHAWLDGALSAEEAGRAEAHVAACGSCAAAVAEARGFIAASSRILSALDDVPAGVVPATTDAAAARSAADTAPTRSRARWLRSSRLRIAASLLFVVGLAAVLGREAQREGFSVREEAATAREGTPTLPDRAAESDMAGASAETAIARESAANGITSAPATGSAAPRPRESSPRDAASERGQGEALREERAANVGATARRLAESPARAPAPPPAAPAQARLRAPALRDGERPVEQSAAAKSMPAPREALHRVEIAAVPAAPDVVQPDSVPADSVAASAESFSARLLDSATGAEGRLEQRLRRVAPAPSGARALAGAAAGAAAVEAPSARPTVALLAGCYALTQGPWTPGVPDEPPAIIELPARVRLESLMGIEEPERGRYVLRPIGGAEAAEADRFGWWEPTSASTVVLGWGIGDRGVIARLARTGDELRGQARTFRGGAETEWVREIVARRTSCEVTR